MGSGWALAKITGKSVTFKSGRSVEVYDRVFLGIFFTLRYSWVSSDIFGYMWFHLFCGGREPNI